ncbi:hypothetical protein TKK_0000022 [Trichogramma kaykai]|uniref:Peptidase S1 domain-containing protein n=1 Tax=Trichogramma kaykai TaxID=54128 RepID=A0ABD2VVA4_9HYME
MRGIVILLYITFKYFGGVDCAPEPARTRIVEGHYTSIASHPHQVSIEYANHHNCGGSILDRHYVITAAHCVHGFDLSQITIRAGSSYREKNGHVHTVQEARVYDCYDPCSLAHDIAIVRVKPPIHLGPRQRAIRLFSKAEPLEVGEWGTVTGWGLEHENHVAYPVNLKQAQVPIVDWDDCQKAYRDTGGIHEGQVCAGHLGVGGNNTCQGDSGGPLVVAGKLAGIVAWAHGCADPKFPTVFTEIAYYRDWIDATIGKNLHYRKEDCRLAFIREQQLSSEQVCNSYLNYISPDFMKDNNQPYELENSFIQYK